jgi:amino acid permease
MPYHRSSGDRWGNILALLPVTYLSAGICTALIIVGGGSMKMLFGIACGGSCLARPLTAVEWYLVFVCAAVVLSQLPNLNSIAGVSLVAAAAAVAYCTMIWAVSVARGRVAGVSYDPVHKAPDDDVDAALGVLNGLGIIAFAFRGHNVVLEIQVSQEKHPSFRVHDRWKRVSKTKGKTECACFAGHDAVDSETPVSCAHVEGR